MLKFLEWFFLIFGYLEGHFCLLNLQSTRIEFCIRELMINRDRQVKMKLKYSKLSFYLISAFRLVELKHLIQMVIITNHVLTLCVSISQTDQHMWGNSVRWRFNFVVKLLLIGSTKERSIKLKLEVTNDFQKCKQNQCLI